MSYRIQVNKKKFSIRIKTIPNQFRVLQIPIWKVSVWRNGTLRLGTTFSCLTPLSEVKQWAKDCIKEGEKENKYFTR